MDYLYVSTYLFADTHWDRPSSPVWLFISQSTFLFRPDAFISSHATLERASVRPSAQTYFRLMDCEVISFNLVCPLGALSNQIKLIVPGHCPKLY